MPACTMAQCLAAFVESLKLKCGKIETVGYLYSADLMDLQKCNRPPNQTELKVRFGQTFFNKLSKKVLYKLVSITDPLDHFGGFIALRTS